MPTTPDRELGTLLTQLSQAGFDSHRRPPTMERAACESDHHQPDGRDDQAIYTRYKNVYVADGPVWTQSARP